MCRITRAQARGRSHDCTSSTLRHRRVHPSQRPHLGRRPHRHRPIPHGPDPHPRPDGSLLGPFGPGSVDLRSVTTWLGLVLGVRLLERAERGQRAIVRGLDRVAGRRARWSRHRGQHRRRAASSARRCRIVWSSSTGAVFLTSSPRLPGASSSATRSCAPCIAGARAGARWSIRGGDRSAARRPEPPRRPSVTLLDELGGRGPVRGGAGRSSTRPGRSSTAGSSCRIDETRRCPWSRRVSYPCPRWSRRCSRPRSAPRPGDGARLLPSRGVVAATGAEQRAAERLVAAIAGPNAPRARAR